MRDTKPLALSTRPESNRLPLVIYENTFNFGKIPAITLWLVLFVTFLSITFYALDGIDGIRATLDNLRSSLHAGQHLVPRTESQYDRERLIWRLLSVSDFVSASYCLYRCIKAFVKAWFHPVSIRRTDSDTFELSF